jgi:hypothetical protein
MSGLRKPARKKEDIPAMSDEKINPEVRVVRLPDTATRLFGDASYDASLNLLTIELHPSVENFRVHVDSFNYYVQHGRPFATRDICDADHPYSVDSSTIATCKFLVPSSGDIEQGAKMTPNWPYNRAKRQPQCSNPAIAGEAKYCECDQVPVMVECRGYVASTWTATTSAYVNDQVTITVEEKFLSNRMPQYRVVIGETSTEYATAADALAAFDAGVEQLRETGANVSIVTTDRDKTRYLNAVLA